MNAPTSGPPTAPLESEKAPESLGKLRHASVAPPALASLPLLIVLAASAACWALLFALIPPSKQDFPLLDDWAFARGAQSFLRGNGVHYFNWAACPQLGQWLWAAPFVWILGATNAALRVSTIVAGLVGLVPFFDLLRQAGRPASRAGFVTAALAFNPLLFLLQGTFMTDVPALSCALLSLALYARALGQQRVRLAVAASVIALVGVLTRQNALAAPLAAAVLLGRAGPQLRRSAGWWTVVLAPVVAGLAVHVWFESRSDARTVAPSLIAPFLVLLRPYWAIHTCGLAAIPALALMPRRAGKPFVLALGVMFIGAAYWLSYAIGLPNSGLFPYWFSTVFSTTGIGSPTLVVGGRPLLLNLAAQLTLTVLGCIGGAALLARLAQHRADRFLAEPLLLFTVVQIAFLVIAPVVHDRHFLFLLPGALYLAAAPTEQFRPRCSAALVCLFAFAATSVALAHDWLSTNAALWSLGQRAVHVRGIPAEAIEGGFEWDGWHSPAARPLTKAEYDRFTQPRREAPAPGLALTWTRRLFPNIEGRYALSFSYRPGTARVESERYSLWLPPGTHEILLLKDLGASAETSSEPRPAPPEARR